MFAEIESYEAHGDWVRDVAWCPNIGCPYDVIVTSSEEGTAKFWRNKGRDTKFEEI